MRRVLCGMTAASVLLLAGCGEGQSSPDPDAASASSPAPTPTPTPTPGERVDGVLKLGSGESVYYWCAGQGGPGVLLESGTDIGGSDAYTSAFAAPLVAETTVCTYDRLGTGFSDPAPERRRTLSDLCAVQEEVLAQLPLPKPYLLVGQSGGGNLSIGCAARRPRTVAGLVTIDSYHDDPRKLEQEGCVWTDNPEYVDYVDYSEELDALDLPIGRFRVLIISATEADPGGEENQRYWLGLSPQSRQVVIEGPHDLHRTAPEQVLGEILEELHHL